MIDLKHPGRKVDLQHLAALEAAATPGPWVYRETPHDCSSEIFPILSEHLGFYDKSACRFADWKFIAAARNALPALLDELRSSRGELSQLRRELEAARRVVSAARKVECGHEWAGHLQNMVAYYDAVVAEKP